MLRRGQEVSALMDEMARIDTTASPLSTEALELTRVLKELSEATAAGVLRRSTLIALEPTLDKLIRGCIEARKAEIARHQRQ